MEKAQPREEKDASELSKVLRVKRKAPVETPVKPKPQA
jgi:hypothetical protein